MSDNEKLKPCECGGSAELKHHCGVFYAECVQCGDQATLSWNDGEAAALWNARQESLTANRTPPTDGLAGELQAQLVDYILALGNRGDSTEDALANPFVIEKFAALSKRLDPATVEALEPVWHWYQSDEHPERPLVDILKDIVADLLADRASALKVPALEHAKPSRKRGSHD